MVNIGAEYNGFCITVIAFQKFRHFLRHDGSAFFNYQVLVVIFCIVNSVFYRVPILVSFPDCRAPAFIIHIQANPDHAVWRKKTIINALFQRISVNRVTKIFRVADLIGFPGSCCKTNVRCFFKVVQNLMPG